MAILKKVENQAMRLSDTDRGRLVHDLISSFNKPISNPDEYEDEIQQRIAKIKSGTAKGISTDQVFSIIENKYA